MKAGNMATGQRDSTGSASGSQALLTKKGDAWWPRTHQHLEDVGGIQG